MAAGQVQISAYVSEETRDLLDQEAERSGLKKGHVIEEALLDYLRALRELPGDVIVPSRITLTPESARVVREALEHPREPTAAMRALMEDDGDDVPG